MIIKSNHHLRWVLLPHMAQNTVQPVRKTDLKKKDSGVPDESLFDAQTRIIF